MSIRTKKFRAGTWIFGSLSFLCNFGLVVAFFIYGLVMGAETAKYTMCLTGIVGVIISLLSVILKRHWRTPLIIVIGGLYFALETFWPVLVTIAVGIVLDEMIFAPLHSYFKSRLTINKEIDIRTEA